VALLNMIPQQGIVLKRVGLPPKRLIPFRCTTPFKKIAATFRAPDEVIHKVEVLADGQQFVAEGIHETTQQPYRWTDNVSLLNVAHEHLPLVDEPLARRFVTEASEIMRRAGWIEIGAKANGNGGNGAANRPLRARPSASSIYGRSALKDECAALAAMPKDSGRNNALNRAAFNLFQLVAGGSLDENEVRERLFAAAEANGLVDEDGAAPVLATIESGAKAGSAQPRQAPEHGNHHDHSGNHGDGVALDDFFAYMPTHSYIFVPTRQMWATSSVNSRIMPQMLIGNDGSPILHDNGEPKMISASAWLDRNRPVEQMTWAPGLPMIIEGQIISEGGWIEHSGVSCFNLYRAPTIVPGIAAEAGPWLDHVRRVFGDEAEHMLDWLAHRVQHPADKINHALVLGGAQGIGKDSALEPVKRAIGPENFIEVSPHHMLGRFNGFLKSVILRVSEARDLGDVNRFQFYDHMNAYTATPPDVLRVDEKHLPEYAIREPRNKAPSSPIAPFSEFAEAGGLLSHGAGFSLLNQNEIHASMILSTRPSLHNNNKRTTTITAPAINNPTARRSFL
jgi:hypothetical protein